MAGPRMCACSYDRSRTDIGQFICPRCVQQWKVITRLYTIAVIHFPSLKKYEPDEFVLLLWAKLGLDKRIKRGHNSPQKPRK